MIFLAEQMTPKVKNMESAADGALSAIEKRLKQVTGGQCETTYSHPPLPAF